MKFSTGDSLNRRAVVPAAGVVIPGEEPGEDPERIAVSVG